MNYLLDFLSKYWLLLLVIFMIVFLDILYKKLLQSGKMPSAFDMSNMANNNMLKFLATTYLTNNAFLEDEKVIKLLTKFNYSKEDVIKFAEEHKDELMNSAPSSQEAPEDAENTKPDESNKSDKKDE